MRRAPARVARRARWVLPALACLLATIPTAAAPSLEAGACPDYRHMPGVGRACRGTDGLLRIQAPDGSVLISHGPDPVAASGSTGSAAPRPPACVNGAQGDYYVVPIYARSVDDADGYASKAATIRSVIQSADGILNAAGAPADLKVLCSSGVIAVANAVLSTPSGSSDFSTIVTDLKRAGFNNPRLKYWVYYDERTSCGCAGMANMASDDRLSADNRNNGNAGDPMFAITFGYLTASTMLHELAHTLGAVQNSAPRTTGAGHCTDGRDVMCYKDGGPTSSRYATSRCATEVFDCGRDDYFNAAPAAGSYLATHWNLASRLNRYLAFDPGGAPVMNSVVCPGKAGLGRPYTCAFRAMDTSTGVAYYVNWGDGAGIQRIPRTGFVSPNVYTAGTRTFGRVSTYRVTVYSVDNGKPARASRSLSTLVPVVKDTTPPTLRVYDPAPGVLYKGCNTKGVYPGRPAIAQRACLFTATSDSGTGVAGVWIYVNNVYAGHTRSPKVEFNVKGPATNVPVRIEVRDFAGNRRSVTVYVDVLL